MSHEGSFYSKVMATSHSPTSPTPNAHSHHHHPPPQHLAGMTATGAANDANAMIPPLSLGANANGMMPPIHVPMPPDDIMSDSDSPRASGLDLAGSTSLDVVQEAKNVMRTFLANHQCYELIKNSGKVVVFDVKIPINLAFFALVEHDIRSVPIWDSDQGKFVGMFTATDFVNILRHFYLRGSPVEQLAEYSIASWRAVPRSLSLASTPTEGMIYVTPDDSLLNACRQLRQHHLHRVPVIDPAQNSVLTILTHTGILDYLVATFREQRRLFDQPIYDLGIGSYGDLITVPEEMPLIRVLHTLIERRVSSIPIVDSKGCVVNIYSVADVTELVKDRSLAQLDMPVGETLRIHTAEGHKREGMHLCYKTDTLHMIFERFAATKVHRFVCVDEYNRCVGMVSLSDLFNYFLPED